MKKICVIGVASLLGLMSCSKQTALVATRLNDRAAMSGDLPSNPLPSKVVTSAVSQRDSTMWTLFGNDLAAHYARTHCGHDYPAGSMLSLATWEQHDDGRWLGAMIPCP